MMMQSDQPTHSLHKVCWEELKRISLYLFSAKAMDVFLYDPLAEANGNDPYKQVLMIFIHCRPIYGADTETKNEALAKTQLFPMLTVRSGSLADGAIGIRKII